MGIPRKDCRWKTIVSILTYFVRGIVIFLSLKMTGFCMNSYGINRQKNILGVILITDRLVKYFTIDLQPDRMDTDRFGKCTK